VAINSHGNNFPIRLGFDDLAYAGANDVMRVCNQDADQVAKRLLGA
jgi:hypothetical protein